MKKIIFAVFLCLAISVNAYAAKVAGLHVWVDGETPTAALWNGNDNAFTTAIDNVESSQIVDGTIVNGDINASAAIVASKIDFTTASAIGSTAPSTGAFTTLSTTSPINIPDGTVANPAIVFTSDTNTGIYRVGLRTVGIATNGIKRFSVDTVSATSTLPFYAPNGTAATPAITFAADADSGLFRVDANTLGIAVGGAELIRIGGLSVSTGFLSGITIGALAYTEENTFSSSSQGTSGSTQMYIGQYTIDTTNPSDENIKKDIKIDDTKKLSDLNKLKVKKYKYKQDMLNDGDIEHTGLIAQEVQALFPEVVHERTDGLLAIDYKALIPAMIQSIQELSKEVDNLKTRVAILEGE